METAAPALVVAEPPAAFATRPPMVVDCSVLSAVLFEEPLRDEAIRTLAGRSLHAPTLIDHEIVSVALKKQAAGWPEDSIALALSDFQAQALDLHRTDAAMQWSLARRYGLSSYDAAYLCLAATLKAPLATYDRKLGAAALRHLQALE